jgi:4-hydroxy-4-methyl-2-oxoglutarate aldolase
MAQRGAKGPMEGGTVAELSELVDRLITFDTCVVSDALDALGYPGALAGIGPTWDCKKIAGRVQTVKLGPAAESVGQPAVHLGAKAIAGAEPGDVIIVDNDAGHGFSAGWGGLLALAASVKGVAGVVVYGAARDIDDVASVGLPMYAHTTTPRTARARTVEVATNGTLHLENVLVEPGDLVLADRSGVVFVKAANAEEVIAKASDLVAKEADMASALKSGTPVTDVLAGNYESMLK